VIAPHLSIPGLVPRMGFVPKCMLSEPQEGTFDLSRRAKFFYAILQGRRCAARFFEDTSRLSENGQST
jgi:hypothetical protein